MGYNITPEGNAWYSICGRGNGQLDSNFLSIPKEAFGFSNYNGKSAPEGFKKHKVMVNDKTKKITIQLYKL